MHLRYTIRQYFPKVGESAYLDEHALDSSELWDELRDQHPNFVFPTNRDEWLKHIASETRQDGLDGQLTERAQAISQLLESNAITHLHSLGVGSAGLEYFLKREMPHLHLTVSEYAPKNVEKLRAVFDECESIRRFDLFNDDWSDDTQQKGHAVMLNRLDPLFSNDQWTNAFNRMGEAGIEHVLYIPAWILSAKSYLEAWKRHLLFRLRGRDCVFTGWARTRKVQHGFWSRRYDHTEHALAGLTGFFLKRRS